MSYSVITATKLVSKTSKALGLGHGSTWPGHIALKLDKNIIKKILKDSGCKVIVIAGTNGKTTTSKMLETILSKSGHKVFHNASGANLVNGIASSMILSTDASGKLNKDFAVFEVDEASLPVVLKELTPDVLVILNLFRDQLDRYGEVNTISDKWQSAVKSLTDKTTLVLNTDDPRIFYLSKISKKKVYFFGLDKETGVEDEAQDTSFCPKCGKKLLFSSRVFSHLGKWECKNCGLKRSQSDIEKLESYPLDGTYNEYNTLASVLTAKILGVDKPEQYLKDFQPAFGRQEEISYKGKTFKIFLSKNPTSFNQSLQTIMKEKPKSILFLLNDRIPDGRDVSWIWDTDIEKHDFSGVDVSISGDRVYDMAVRLKYALAKETAKTYESLENAIEELASSKAKIIHILPTYSAMLEVRKVLKGQKIL